MSEEVQLKKRNIVSVLMVIIVLLSFMSSSVFSASTKQLSHQVSYFVDDSQRIKAEQMIQLSNAGWTKVSNETTFGLTKSVYWFKVDVNPRAFQVRDVVVEVAKPQLEHVNFYYAKDNKLVEVRTGASIPAMERLREGVNFSLPISFEGESVKSVYISVQTSSYMTVPIHVFTLEDYAFRSTIILVMNMIYYGVLILIVVYHAFLYKRLKDNVYAIYLTYLISVGLTQFIWDGYIHYWLYPYAPEIVSRLNAPLVLLVAVSLVAFVLEALQSAFSLKFIRSMRWVLKPLFVACVVLFSLDSIWSTDIATKMTVLLDLVALALCFWAMRYNQEARIYAVALSILVAGIFMNIAIAFKWLPYNLFTLNAPKLGNSVEMLLLSIALSRKVQLVRLRNGTSERQQSLVKRLKLIQDEWTKFERLDEATQQLIEGVRAQLKVDSAQFIIRRNAISELLAYTGDAPRLTIQQIEGLTNLCSLLPVSLSQLQLKLLQLERYDHVIVLPIWTARELSGFILLQGKVPNLFIREDIHLLSDFAEQIAQMLRRTELIRELRSHTEYDSLTGLLSYRAFMDEYRQAFAKVQQTGGVLTVIIVDIDCFMRINEMYGYIVGDAVLTELGRYMNQYFYEDTVIARFGGEGFIGFVKQTKAETAERLAQLRNEIAATPLFITGETPNVNVTVSIGTASYTSLDCDYMSLVNRADQALYKAKISGRNQVIAQ